MTAVRLLRGWAVAFFAATTAVTLDTNIAAGIDFSGAIRERATYQSAIDFDEDAPDTGWFWAQRVRLTADAGKETGISGRLSVLSALQWGLDESPVQENRLAVQEGYIDIASDTLRLRTGRQEVSLGSQRLVGTRDGTNVRRNWEGFRATGSFQDWTAEAIYLNLVGVEPSGAFNDRRLDERLLSGIYATRSGSWTDFDLYYLYSDLEEKLTIAGPGSQRRHSVGARVFGERGPWFWNWEAVYQWGNHEDEEIRAWTLASNTGYSFDAPGSPALMLSVNIASGDSDPDDGRLETFDALYPRGNYFSDLAQLGPANFFNINPYLTFNPAENVAVSLDVNFYWRLEKTDGIYGPPGNLIRPPGGSDERFVNTAISLSVGWQISRHWFAGVSLAHSIPEAFIEDTGPADPANYAEFTLKLTL